MLASATAGGKPMRVASNVGGQYPKRYHADMPPDDRNDDEPPLPESLAQLVEAVQDLLIAEDRFTRAEDVSAAQRWVEWLADRMADLSGDGYAVAAGSDADDVIDAVVHCFLADVVASMDGFEEGHPFRNVCEQLHLRRAELRKAVAVKRAQDTFRTSLGLPPLCDGVEPDD